MKSLNKLLTKIRPTTNKIPDDKILGEFQNFHYPKHAECLNVSDYEISISVQSKFVEGEQVNHQVPVCPNCQIPCTHEREHGRAIECGNCGLKSQSYGKALYVWDDNKNIEFPNNDNDWDEDDLVS
jgi:ribosomal protein L37AE/L43A